MVSLADIQALPPEIVETRNTAAIAAALPPVLTLKKTAVGKGKILDTIELSAGNALLDVIDNSPDFRHIKHLVFQGVLDLSSSRVRDTLDELGSGIIPEVTSEHTNALKAIAEVYTPISEYEVRRVCWSNTGQWLVGEQNAGNI